MKTINYYESLPFKTAASADGQYIDDVTVDSTYDNDAYQSDTLPRQNEQVPGSTRIVGRSEGRMTSQQQQQRSSRNSAMTENNRLNELHEQRRAQNNLAGALCRCLRYKTCAPFGT